MIVELLDCFALNPLDQCPEVLDFVTDLLTTGLKIVSTVEFRLDCLDLRIDVLEVILELLEFKLKLIGPR